MKKIDFHLSNFQVSLCCIIAVVLFFSVIFLTNNSWWILPMVLLFVLGLWIGPLRKVLSNKKKSQTIPVIVHEEPKEPEFKKTVREYKPYLPLVNTPKKAKENFAKCAALFLELCPKSGNEYYTVEELLKLGVPSIEGQYHNSEFEYGIRARLSIPSVDKIYVNNFNYTPHVPVITTGDHQNCTEEVFHYFVSQFIERGLVIKFNL